MALKKRPKNQGIIVKSDDCYQSTLTVNGHLHLHVINYQISPPGTCQRSKDRNWVTFSSGKQKRENYRRVL